MIEDSQGLKIQIGKPHPRYPSLVVDKINKNGDIKIKGMNGYRNRHYPFLMALTPKDHKLIDEGVEYMKKHGSLNAAF